MILAGLLLGVIALGSWMKIPKKTQRVERDGSADMFPTVAGTNLDRVDMTFPRDFAGQVNVVFVPFQQWQQRQVDSWVPYVQQLESDNDAIRYYELPTVWEMSAMRRTFLNEGMRAGIPNQTSRERTITLYLDKPAFRERLAIPDESTMHLLLVTGNGEIIGRTEGDYSAEKSTVLTKLIEDYFSK